MTTQRGNGPVRRATRSPHAGRAIAVANLPGRQPGGTYLQGGFLDAEPLRGTTTPAALGSGSLRRRSLKEETCRDPLGCRLPGGTRKNSPRKASWRRRTSTWRRVVFMRRSHMSTENYRCAAPWLFDVAQTAGGSYDVTVSSSDPNGREANDTPEYRDTRESSMTRHYDDAAMAVGDSACTASRVGELVAPKGELWRT